MFGLALVLLVGARAPAVGAEDEHVEARWKALAGEVTQRLHALAGWCKERQLYTCRAEAYETLLMFAPEDAEARKALTYVRDAQGVWRRDPKYKPIRNQAKGADEYATRLEVLRAWFGQAAAPLIEEAATDAPRRRSAWLAAALALAPDVEVLRTLNEEVREGAEAGGAGGSQAGRWILAESHRARARRIALRKAGRDAVAQVPDPKPGTVEDLDRHGALEWPHVLQFEGARVLGFAPREELERAGRHVEAVGPVLRAALGIESWEDRSERMRYGRGRTLYVFIDPTSAMGWLGKQPRVDERYLEFVAPLVGTSLPERAADVVKSTQEDVRLESAPRLAVSRAIYRHTYLTRRQAWIYEGLTIYLTWLITGTRLIYSVNDVEARYAEDRPPIPSHIARMTDPAFDWLDLALELFEVAGKPDLFLLPGKDFNQITKEEVLYAYAVAAWAVEGHADKALELFQGLGGEGGTDLDAVCLKVLGYDARTLEARVKRWLQETTGARKAR